MPSSKPRVEFWQKPRLRPLTSIDDFSPRPAHKRRNWVIGARSGQAEMNIEKLEIPHHGIFHPARGSAHKPVVIFVHHYGGNNQTTKRHVRFVNALGFDAISFTATYNDMKPGHFAYPRSRFGRWGLRHCWAEEILDVVGAIDRSFILYSFSSLSNSAIEAVVLGEKKPLAWICDGGPFLMDWERLKSYGKVVVGVRNPVALAIGTVFSYLIWDSYHLQNDLKNWLDVFPENLPVLSFQGEIDPLVPPKFTQAVFNLSARVQPKVCLIPGGLHLDGLKNHREVYAPVLREFLEACIKP